MLDERSSAPSKNMSGNLILNWVNMKLKSMKSFFTIQSYQERGRFTLMEKRYLVVLGSMVIFRWSFWSINIKMQHWFKSILMGNTPFSLIMSNSKTFIKHLLKEITTINYLLRTNQCLKLLLIILLKYKRKDSDNGRV